MAVSQPNGTLLAAYLVGLLILIVGVALALTGMFQGAGLLTAFGFAVAALGLFLVVMKIVARNKPH